MTTSLAAAESSNATANRRPSKVFFTAFALLFIPMTLWALASPLGSVPDEPSHAIRAAAVVRGQLDAIPWKANLSLARSEVPRYVANMHNLTCYVGKPELTPACEVPLRGSADTIVTTGNSAGANTFVYYAIVGLPSLVLSGDAALYGMRLVNVLLCALALAVMFMQLASLRHFRWAVTIAMIAITPMVLFLAGAVNPNALEVASSGALFATLVALFTTHSTRRVLWGRAGLVVVSTGLLLGTRSISLLWLLLVVAASLLMLKKEVFSVLLRRPPVWVMVGLSAAMALSATWFYAMPPSMGPAIAQGEVTSSGTAFITMLVRTFEFSDGYVGYFGWLDTPSPAFSTIVWSALIVAAIVGAFAWGSGRVRWAAGGLGLAMLAVPPVTQAILAPQLGYIWQGRYMLALLLCFLLACGLALDASPKPLTLSTKAAKAVLICIALLAAGQCLSFIWALRRYVIGSHGSPLKMLVDPTWQPPLGWLVLVALMIAWAAVASVVVYRALYSPLSMARLNTHASRIAV